MGDHMSGVVIDELLVFSDHHAHPFTFGAKEVEWGGTLVNSRLVNSARVLQQMNTYARKHKINTVVFCGDLFHTREAVSTDAYNATFDQLYPLFAGRTAFAIPGNHDYHDRAGLTHSLDTLKYWRNNGSLRIVDWTKTDKSIVHTGKRGDEYMLCFVPYTEDRNLAIKTIEAHAAIPFAGPKLLFAHLGMQGATVGSDYVLVNAGDVAVSDTPYDKFAGCLFGHYHQHQKLFPNGWYVGATHHHTWGDVNTKRGFLHVRVYIDHIDFDFIESDAPKFLATTEAELETAADSIKEGDFVKIVTDKKLSLEQTNKMRARTKSEVCEVIYIPPEIKMKDISLDEQQLSPAAMVDTWVKANMEWLKVHDVEREELVRYGRTLLAKAAQEQQ